MSKAAIELILNVRAIGMAKYWSKFLSVLLMLVLANPVIANAKTNKDQEMVFSILPFLSPVVLMKRFSPLRQYLEDTTGKTIVIESAPSFPEYLRRTVNHDYDIVYTAPHFVPYTLKDGHYELLAASNDIAAHLVVSNASGVKQIEQLAGKRIAHGPKQAFLVIIAKYLLKEKGLTGDKAPKFVQYKSHNAALRAVVGKEADAAVIGTFMLKQAAENQLTEVAATPFYPGVAILASKQLPEAFRKQLAKSFVDIKKSEQGRGTLKKIRFPGFRVVTSADYKPLDAIARDALDPKTFELIQK